MQARIRNPAMIIPESMDPLMALGAITKKRGPAKVLGLLHLRVSQINGCAACLDLHLRAPKQDEPTPEQLVTLPAWRESPYFSPAERAALALAEQITHIDRDGVTDDVWQEAARHFDEATLANLVLYVGIVNLYNRMNVATKQVAGPQEWERRNG
jgi:AhpD family alkylhydroperoxidase